ncbi:uncharacterized protein I206_107619 [Kwoniella pini CBS 10737]|uniref:Uncharacterized protein n=1 Tax=Kwoniella pini CBS 10737 TaxID=1296096 RepID=A0AAJ8LBD3_9TREE
MGTPNDDDSQFVQLTSEEIVYIGNQIAASSHNPYDYSAYQQGQGILSIGQNTGNQVVLSTPGQYAAFQQNDQGTVSAPWTDSAYTAPDYQDTEHQFYSEGPGVNRACGTDQYNNHYFSRGNQFQNAVHGRTYDGSSHALQVWSQPNVQVQGDPQGTTAMTGYNDAAAAMAPSTYSWPAPAPSGTAGITVAATKTPHRLRGGTREDFKAFVAASVDRKKHEYFCHYPFKGVTLEQLKADISKHTNDISKHTNETLDYETHDISKASRHEAARSTPINRQASYRGGDIMSTPFGEWYMKYSFGVDTASLISKISNHLSHTTGQVTIHEMAAKDVRIKRNKQNVQSVPIWNCWNEDLKPNNLFGGLKEFQSDGEKHETKISCSGEAYVTLINDGGDNSEVSLGHMDITFTVGYKTDLDDQATL